MEGSNSTSIKLFCHVQSALAVQVQSAQANIKVRLFKLFIIYSFLLIILFKLIMTKLNNINFVTRMLLGR